MAATITTAESVGAILERRYPEMIREARSDLARQFMAGELSWATLVDCWPPSPADSPYKHTPPEDHLKWARGALQIADCLRLEHSGCPATLARIALLRERILAFGADAEAIAHA